MQQDYIENLKGSLNHLQKPWQEIMELNVKALQKISYLKPEELRQLKSPEDFLDKNVAIFIQNGHKTLDYMQQAFQICEKYLLNMTPHKERKKY